MVPPHDDRARVLEERAAPVRVSVPVDDVADAQDCIGSRARIEDGREALVLRVHVPDHREALEAPQEPARAQVPVSVVRLSIRSPAVAAVIAADVPVGIERTSSTLPSSGRRLTAPDQPDDHSIWRSAR